jgi:D-aspartate ligase
MNKHIHYTIPALSCSEIGLVHSLGTVGIPVYTGSFYKDNTSLYSKYTKRRVIFSPYDTEQYIKELCEYGKSLDERPVLYSDDDRAILMISRNRKKLQKYYRFLLPEQEMIEKILDKRQFCDVSKKYDLPAPASFYVTSKKDLKDVSGKVTYPCIVKPAFKQDWWHPDFFRIVGPYKKAYECETIDDLVTLYDKLIQINSNAVIQEYVQGDDENLFSVNLYINQQGALRGFFIAQKRRIYPINAGTGCYVVTVNDDEIMKMSLDVARKLNLKGLLNIQFKKDSRTGEPKLMEIHARNSFWSFLGTAAGMNLSALYYHDLTDTEEQMKAKYHEGVKFIDLGKDIKAFIQYHKIGKLKFLDWLKTYSGNYVIGGYLLKDPSPIVMSLWFMLSKRVKGHVQKGAAPS